MGESNQSRKVGIMEVNKDASGKPSSKRTIAFSGFVVMAFISVYAIIKEPAQAGNIIWPWAIMVGALLGVTVLEKK